jgi:hypothetical protein
MQTWILPPDFTFLKDGPLQLGAVIVHPKQPGSILATGGQPGLSLPPKRVELVAGQERVHEVVDDQGQVWLERYSAVEHEIQTLAGPLSDDALGALLRQRAVQRYIHSDDFDKLPVYIVTGLRIATHAFSVTHEIQAAEDGVPAEGIWPPAQSYQTEPGAIFAFSVIIVRLDQLDDDDSGDDGVVFSRRSGVMAGAEEENTLEIADVTAGIFSKEKKDTKQFTKSVWDGDHYLSFVAHFAIQKGANAELMKGDAGETTKK